MLLYLQTHHKQFIDTHAYCANLDKCPSFLPTKPDLTPTCLLFQILQPLLLMPATHAESLQSCPTLCNSMDCSPPGSSVCETLHARTLEWVIISFSRGLSQPRDWTWVSRIAGRFFTTEPPEIPITLSYTWCYIGYYSLYVTYLLFKVNCKLNVLLLDIIYFKTSNFHMFLVALKWIEVLKVWFVMENVKLQCIGQ